VSVLLLPADDAGAIAQAARILREGGLVAFPTETVYGLGADALDVAAVARIFAAKGRPTFDPLIVHLADRTWLERVVGHAPEAALRLAARFWPGPLTLVLPKREVVPGLVTAGLDTVGVRVPDHPAARALIAAADRPIAAPSANLFGHVSPTTAAHVVEQLGDRVDAVLDGGPCRVGVESTIVSFASGAPVVLRPGGVTREDLAEALGGPVGLARERVTGDAPLVAPGQLDRHYATRTPLRLLSGRAQGPGSTARVGLLAFAAAPASGFAAVEVLAPDGQPATAAANLFAALRRLDACGLDLLLAEPCSEEGLGSAIMDRLRRCAAGAV
jgi:L-threonylcarbamoyladenylate synthase